MAEGKIFLKENRDRIEKKYREQMMGLPQVFAEIDKKLAECTDEVALACKYLYAFMPYSDIGNYAFEVFWIMRRMAYIYGRKTPGWQSCRRKSF